MCMALVGMAGSAAWGDTVTFYNTGVADNGTLLGAGASDPHYSLVYSNDPNGTTATATAANPNWEQQTATAGWISPGSSGDQSWASGYYVYETLLDLTGYDPTTALLSGLIAADNNVSIYLNGSSSAVYGASGFSYGTSFLINSGFVSGINEIYFAVYNGDGPSGLMVDNTLATANAETPEAGTLLLLATGTAVGGFYVMRKARQPGAELRQS